MMSPTLTLRPSLPSKLASKYIERSGGHGWAASIPLRHFLNARYRVKRLVEAHRLLVDQMPLNIIDVAGQYS